MYNVLCYSINKVHRQFARGHSSRTRLKLNTRCFFYTDNKTTHMVPPGCVDDDCGNHDGQCHKEHDVTDVQLNNIAGAWTM